MVTAFLGQLRETKGAIINIGSIQSFVALRIRLLRASQRRRGRRGKARDRLLTSDP